MNNIFSCEGITKNYNDEAIVQEISLELSQGGFISLVGPSGVGKTTLFNVLAGVDSPDAGKVFLRGEDITGTSGKVSYMPQKDLLLEYRTVIDNVILPLLIRGENKNTAREFAAEFFPMFGLEGYEKNYPHELSGGMRQRAALLRTCLTSCDTSSQASMPHNSVILLDEPFSALDAITRHKTRIWYAGIAEKMCISSFFITHDVEEAIVLSDTVYIMNGKPGLITHKIDVQPPRPRETDFSVSKEFVDQKRIVLDAIGV